MSPPGVSDVMARFSLEGRVVIITGGAGLLGRRHGRAVAQAGGVAVLADVREEDARAAAAELSREIDRPVVGLRLDVTDPDSVRGALAAVLEGQGRVDVLINNAAHNPKVEDASLAGGRLETFPLARFEQEVAVGLTGAFVCAQVVGSHLAAHGGGVILNIASDLGVIAPDQRIYAQPGLPRAEQPVKPVTYSVVKGGLVMLTRYLATYWAEDGVRVNSLSPGGVEAGQPADFVERLTRLIPLGRMARRDEYEAAVVFLCSDASSYMTGANLVVDGGRTCW